MVIDADHVAAFATAIGADPSAGVPPTYAAVYALFSTFPALAGDPEAAVDFARLLHSEQEFRWDRHPEVGESVHAQGVVVQDVDRRGLRLLTYESACESAAAPFCVSTMISVIRP